MGTREICKACWRVNAVGFTVPDEVWEASVPEKLKNEVLCLGCFTQFADENGVEWDANIQFWPVSRLTAITPGNEL